MDLVEFEWDDANLEHIGAHGVTAPEVEEAATRSHEIIEAREVNGEKRWKLFGKSAAGRYLVVVFTIRERRFRAVTAYTMNRDERRIHAPQID